MIELTITGDELRRALSAVEAAEKQGFMHCLAVVHLISAGQGIHECSLSFSDIIERAHPTDGWKDWGRFQGISLKYKFKDGKLVPRRKVSVKKVSAKRISARPTMPTHLSANYFGTDQRLRRVERVNSLEGEDMKRDNNDNAAGVFDEVCFLAREYGMGDPKKMTEGARKLRSFVRRRMKKIIKEFGFEFAKLVPLIPPKKYNFRNLDEEET